MHRICALALLALATGCDQKTQGPDSRRQAVASGANPLTPTPAGKGAASTSADDPILIGEVGSLTGSEATFGISARNGIQLAIEQANAEGGVRGRKIAVRVYDDRGKPEEAANATIRLISQDHVKVILGEEASSNSLAMAQKAQAARVPMISPSSTNPKVTQVGDYIFRASFIDPFQGLVMARFARENLKVNSVAVLEDQKSDYSLGLTEYFKRRFTEMGGKIVDIEAYAKGDTDFRSQLTAIKGHRPDAIFIPGYYTDVGIIARQARELGIKSTLLGSDGWSSDKLFELGGTALDGSYFSDHYSPENPAPQVQKFVAQYKAAYGISPDTVAGLGYDAARVAIAAMRRAKDLSGPAIRDAIAETKDFPGAAGNLTLNENRDAVKPAVVLQVDRGRLKYITSVPP
jgi:branched-chain amino acid transport system substrate-binding protein